MTHQWKPREGVDWERVFRKGADLAQEHCRRGATIDERAVMWALFVDAVKTTAVAYDGPPFSGWPSKSSMPEPEKDFSIWAQIAAYLRGDLDEMPTDESKPPRPSAEQISRADAILWIWHAHALREKGNWSNLRKAVYTKACGFPDRKIRAITGLTRHQIRHACDLAMQDMCSGVAQMRNLA